MSKVYDALKALEDNSFQSNDRVLSFRQAPAPTEDFSKELLELENFVADKLRKIRTAVDAEAAAATSESRQAAQSIESLKGEIKLLEAQLRETTALLERKEMANQQLEQERSAKITEMEIVAQQKDKVLANRLFEINALNVEVNRLRGGINNIVNFFNEQVQALGSNSASGESLKAEVQALAISDAGKLASAKPDLDKVFDSGPSIFERGSNGLRLGGGTG